MPRPAAAAKPAAMSAHPAHAHGPATLSSDARRAATSGITALSVAVAAVLIVIKAAAWWASGSVAVLASLADSGLDLAASLITFFVVQFAAKAPDAEHRFGHGKAEAFASLMQAALVLVSAALVGREAVVRLLRPQPIAAEGWAMAVMGVSIVLTAALVLAQTGVLKRTGSVAVEGDRAHYLADLGSNAASLLGVAGAALLGAVWLDAAAALFVCAWLLWSAFGVFSGAVVHLMDRELPDEDRARIAELVRDAHPAIGGVRQLRTRSSGSYLHVQAHVDLPPTMTLGAVDQVLIAAERRILEVYPNADVLLHPEPAGEAEPHPGPIAGGTLDL